MGLVFNEVSPKKFTIRPEPLVVLTSVNVKFLRSLGFKVNTQNA